MVFMNPSQRSWSNPVLRLSLVCTLCVFICLASRDAHAGEVKHANGTVVEMFEQVEGVYVNNTIPNPDRITIIFTLDSAEGMEFSFPANKSGMKKTAQKSMKSKKPVIVDYKVDKGNNEVVRIRMK